MLYALVLIQVANLIVVTTIDPSNYNRSINQHRHSNQQPNQYRPNYPQSQRQILFGKNFSIEKQNISKLFSTISVPIYQLQPSSKQRHYVGHVYNITINRPTKAVDRSKSLLLRADNTGTGKAALKKGKYRPIPNQYYHHLIHHHYQPIVSGIDNLILSSISYRLPTIDTSPHYYYPIWRNQFELKQTNSATTTSSPLPATTSDLISLSSSSSSSSSLTSSASLMSSATQYYDPDDSEILIQRTAPDTSAGFFAKALDNMVRFFPTRMRDRQNPGCVGGTKCQFFAFCWMSGGSLGASCGPLHTCCITPSSQDIQPKYWGPVINDPECGKSATRVSRIVGGSDASFGQFPWQAFVQVGGSRCGGALVGPAHVVTAGHCVARSQHNPSSIRVTLGDYILHSEIESLPHEVFTVSEVKLHPNFRFTPQADRYDVAVLVLDRSVQYRENIMPICLPPKGTIYIGRMAYVAGWGALQAGSKLRPKVLQHVPVPVIENNICENWHKQRGINIKIYDEMMCAGYETGGKDACQGDSGGPLMLNEFGVWYLIGIVSAGYSCAKQYQPGIYHRVSSSSDWVSANVFPSTHFRVPS